MTIYLLRKGARNGIALLTFAGLLGAASLAIAATDPPPKKPEAAKPDKPPAKAPEAAAKPTGGPGAGSHGTPGHEGGQEVHTPPNGGMHGTPADDHRGPNGGNHPNPDNGRQIPNNGPGNDHRDPNGGNHSNPDNGRQIPNNGPGNDHRDPNAGMRENPSNEHITNKGPDRQGSGPGQFSHGPDNANHSGFANGPGPRGSNEHVANNGNAFRTRQDGKVSDVHDVKRGMDIHHGLDGGRRVSVERADHSRIVVEHGRRGFDERAYDFHGHQFERRAYFDHGHEYNRFYRGFFFHGLNLQIYAPGFYYHPAFYGWAYRPWARPINYGWGWGGSPWYAQYGYYFQPYQSYPSASFWLTDYIISRDLQAAYAAHQEGGEMEGSGGSSDGQPVMTPEVKQMIADEVRNQLALENQEGQQIAQQQDVDPGSSGIARLLSDGRPHVFVAGGNLDVTDASGHECVVSDGDTLQLRTPPPSDASSANLVVLSSKGSPECQISLTVQVQLADLQEMQNHMRETIDQGLQDLEAKQGTDGLPPAPPAALGQPTTPEYASVAPPPDPNLGAEIQQQDAQSNQAENDINAGAYQGGGAENMPPPPPGGPGPVQIGESMDQVVSTLGQPRSILNIGSKTTYGYKGGLKITFKDGYVTDVKQ